MYVYILIIISLLRKKAAQRIQKQAAQLWQRDCSKLDIFPLTSSVIRKITNKIGFLGHPMGIRSNICTLSEDLTQRNFVKSFIKRMSALLVKQRISVSVPLFFGGLRGNVCISSLAGWKARGRFPIGYNCR